jgi:hypothetical protein
MFEWSCIFGQFWVIVMIAHFSLYLDGSYSKTAVSHYRYVHFSIERSEWHQLYWFIILYGISELSKWHFCMPHAQLGQRALKCYPWNWQSTISLANKLNQFLYGQFFKIYTHSCFLCQETTATSCDSIVTSLVTCYGTLWRSLTELVIHNSNK